MEIKVNVRGLKLSAAKEAVERTLRERSFLQPVGLLIGSAAKRNLNESKAAAPYAPLKAATLHEKKRLGYSSRPLIRTGEMQRSILSQVRGDTLQLGARQWLKYHHFGAKKIPRRPIYYLRREDLEEVAMFFKRAFQRITGA